jgi:hypothetical protein
MSDGSGIQPRFKDAKLPRNSVAVPTAEFQRIQTFLRRSGRPSDPQSVSRWYVGNKP